MVKLMTKTAKALVVLFAVLALLIQPGIARTQEKPDEVKMGREAAAEVEKEAKLSKDEAAIKRVQTIGKAIADVANSVEVPALYGSSQIAKFDYSFKVIEDKDINAFSLPGGFIFVNSGLLDFVQSDHELAAVLAHEVTHAAHHHMIQLLKEQQKLDNKIAMLLLAGLIGRVPGPDLGNIVMGAQLFRIAKVSGYGQQAERDSDLAAIRYMQKAGYNPVGLLTFLERLSRKPDLVEWGIYQTHPEASERAKAVQAALESLKIPINRRLVTDAAKASARAVTIDGKEVAEVVLKDTVLFRPAPENGEDSLARANRTAEKINAVLDKGLQLRDIRVPVDRPVVLARGEPLIEISLNDAALSQQEPQEVAKRAADAIRRVLWSEMVDQMH